MKREEVKKIVLEEMNGLGKRFSDKEFKENDVIANIGLDSLDQVELIMNLERKFNFGIPDIDVEDMQKMKVEKFIDYITERVNEKQ